MTPRKSCDFLAGVFVKHKNTPVIVALSNSSGAVWAGSIYSVAPSRVWVFKMVMLKYWYFFKIFDSSGMFFLFLLETLTTFVT